jgi:ParB-like chromosome segregation protein Spo0J
MTDTLSTPPADSQTEAEEPTKLASVEEPGAESGPTTQGQKTSKVLLSAITSSPEAQQRAGGISDELVDEYCDAMMRGAPRFPPLTVFYDGVDYHIADGHHRFLSALKAFGPKNEIECVVYAGSLRDAIVCSCGANAVHGARRTNADKRRAIATLLNDAEWLAWSDSTIAMRCHVSDKTVAKYRAELASLRKSAVSVNADSSTEQQCQPHLRKSEDRPRTVKRGNSVYSQRTAKIGQHAPAPSAAPDSVVVPISASESPSVDEKPIAGPAIDGGKLAVSAPPRSELGLFQNRIQRLLNDLHKEGRKKIEATNPRMVLDRTLLLERELTEGAIIPPNKRYEKWKATLPADAERKTTKYTAGGQTGTQTDGQLDLVEMVNSRRASDETGQEKPGS